MIRLYRIDHVRQNTLGGRYVPNPLIVNDRQLRNMLPDSLMQIYGASWDLMQDPLPDEGEAKLCLGVGYWEEYHLARWKAIGWTNHVETPTAAPRPKWYQFWWWAWWLD